MLRPVLLALLCAAPARAAETGTVTVPADAAGAPVAERFRLDKPYTGTFALAPRYALRHSGVTVYDLTFPSPVTSDIPENNTVPARYFVPNGPGPFPAVIVLDILQGNQMIARGEAMWLAQNGVAALVVVLPHYNERRAPNGRAKLMSADLARTMDGLRQGVLDCRVAAAWLAQRPEVDPERLGMVGTSLGSFLSALTAANEPRIKSACLLLGGGGLVDAYYDHPKAKPVTEVIDLLGGKNLVKKLIAPVDPITYAPQLKGKNVLLVAARNDEVVPPKAARQLWEATGRPKIVWLDAGHVTAGFFAMSVLCEVRDHCRGAGK